MLTPIRVLIVEDDPKVRRALRMRFQLEPTIDIVGEADDGPTAIELSVALRPDVVLLDLNLPGMDGVSVCYALRSHAAAVVVLSMYETATVRARCLAAGASTFVAKQDRMSVLLSAIHAALGPTPPYAPGSEVRESTPIPSTPCETQL